MKTVKKVIVTMMAAMAMSQMSVFAHERSPAAAGGASGPTCRNATRLTQATLAGNWELVATEVVLHDGHAEKDYGEAPKGLMMIDAAGRYSLQIYQSDRPRFVSGDKRKGSAEEYAAATRGASTHFGRIEVDEKGGELRFIIENALFPNWEGQQQERRYEWCAPVLRYYGKPRPDGGVPVSIWRRAK